MPTREELVHIILTMLSSVLAWLLRQDEFNKALPNQWQF